MEKLRLLLFYSIRYLMLKVLSSSIDYINEYFHEGVEQWNLRALCISVLGLINFDLESKTLIEAYLETGVVY